MSDDKSLFALLGSYKRKIIFSGIGLCAVIMGFSTAYVYRTQGTVLQRLSALERGLDVLTKEINDIDQAQQRVTVSPKEVIRREVIREKSQDELLTTAVAKAAPAVVSIVVSQDVAKLEVVYRNPFGSDPLFRDFDIRIPVYRQRGVEQQKVGAGTGFLVRADGYILTNRHVLSGDATARYSVLLSNGTQKQASVVYRDASHDIALLKIDGAQYPTLELGPSGQLKLGQAVVAIGNALGEYNNSVSVGIISGLDRTIRASSAGGKTEELKGVIQTDAAINPGNSGGPLLDLNGRAVGINVATVMGSSNISFSIPSDTVKMVLKQVLNL
ncbi:MAG: peptidase S1 and S6, chymotrypsin/Hap [Parcubacteria group bacterium Gr01-1014_66]|nr:MAG: peptidase S1 and S6, chymotrypsin/Hap [Parcubacteria group bacterium Gr01-1014_66]